MGGFLTALYDPVISPLDPLGVRNWRRWVIGAAHGVVLEIGVGTGLNLAHYRAVESVTAIDPDEASLKRAAARATRAPVRVRLVEARAEDLPFPDRHFDSVLNTLVLCSVADLERALGEVRRVLKPGGTFRLIEHVRVQNRVVAGLQDAVTPLWKQLAGGCHLNRQTLAAIERTGFQVKSVQPHIGGFFVGIDAQNPPERENAGNSMR